MQEILGENPGEIGQQHLRFVRRGVCCCSAVARESSLVTVALLGRFLPRLGPLPQGERSFSFSARVSSAAHFFIRTVHRRRAAPVLPNTYSAAAARYGRNSSSGIAASRSARTSNST